ncbi:hypothetical protein [Bradyrhizobium sp. Tv2a-2]|uniref:hypothetical protein n=1 Tax=Bradyrhizobium sp. Tv2a-2 TaxID=113395 RepID=UPI0012EBE4B6|nr:hypothetical protein [Bradyrhizobium sp. Tv2a-2]
MPGGDGEGSDVQPDVVEAKEEPWINIPGGRSYTLDEINRMTADAPPAPEPTVFRPMDHLEGTSGALHAVHMRLIEMLPFLPAAIEEADGALKAFLEMLMGILKA